jgi:hypothetical protein
MKRYLSLLACFCFLMAQCHKSNNSFIKVSGKVLEFGSNKPIANAKVGIYEEGGVFLGPTWTKFVDSTHTDTNGFYNMEKQNIDNGSSFYISAAANKYYTFDPTKYLVTGKGIVNNDIVLDPFAWIKVHVKNVTPFDENDRIILGNVVGEATTSGDYVGRGIDLTYINKVKGNTGLRASWTVRKNNIGKQYVDTIKIAAHDTLKYEILY